MFARNNVPDTPSEDPYLNGGERCAIKNVGSLSVSRRSKYELIHFATLNIAQPLFIFELF